MINLTNIPELVGSIIRRNEKAATAKETINADIVAFVSLGFDSLEPTVA